MTSTKDNSSIDLVRLALSECQTTIRGYDTKAQIVGVGYIFALGIIFDIYKALPGSGEVISLGTVILIWSVMIFPIVLFGFVLYPSRKTIKKTLSSKKGESKTTLYLELECYENVQQYRQDLIEKDFLDELTNELFKVSALRELKRKRFLRGLFASGAAFLVLFAGQLQSVLLR